MARIFRRCAPVLLFGALGACASPMLYTLTSGNGENFELSSIDSSGAVNRLFDVGIGFTGGLAFDPVANLFYAISNDWEARSTLNSISWSGEVRPLFELGYGYCGGLTWAGKTGTLYAIAGDKDGVQRSLYQIDVPGGSSTPVDDLAEGEFSFDGGLSYSDQLYLLGHNGEATNLFIYSPLDRIQDLEGVYRSVFFPAAGGLVWDPNERVWWALTADRETYQPMLMSFDRTGGVAKFGFDLGLTGLTLAEDPAPTPEPASALLLAAGLAAILWYKRSA